MFISRYVEPERSLWEGLCSRPSMDDPSIGTTVQGIIDTVRSGGDKALLELEEKLDKAVLSEGLKVSEKEFGEAETLVPESLKEAMLTARDNIRRFHQAQLPAPVRVETSPGVVCVQRAVPIRRVGLYVPGGRAPLFSTVLMLSVPAKVAGCPDIVLCTPPDPEGRVNPAILYAASICGVTDVFKVGGAQAIAAMACGTESISRRDKIFGPGNRYVTKAKQMVSGSVAIDMPAGPSEVMVIADDSANPAFVASDFMSQAEHGPDSQSVLVCSSEKMADSVTDEIGNRLESLSRKDLIMKSLSVSRIVILKDRDSILDFANDYAPEHLIIHALDPWKWAEDVVSAGSVFLGPWSPESAGDYASGTNHTLPTGGWAKSLGGLNVDSFLRKMTIQELTEEGLRGIGNVIKEMAVAEGLDAHAAAVSVRLGNG